MLNKGTIFTED